MQPGGTGPQNRKRDGMCLAIPARVTELADDGLATVDILGVTRQISLDLTPGAGVGSYVLVHAGFAIEVIDQATAQETIELIRQFPDLIGEDIPDAAPAAAAGGVPAEAAAAAPAAASPAPAGE